MIHSPKVSVIITCFNQGKYLVESIGSVINQSYSDWECIIVNDGSTDNSEEIASNFASKDPRINYFYQKNQGVAFARNFGLSIAQGSFIQFLDADDLINKDKLSYQIEQLKLQQEIDIIFGSSRYFFDGNSEVTYPLHPNGAIPCDLSVKDRFQVEMIFKNNICTNCSALIRREVIQNVKFRNLIYEDWIFNLEASLNGFIFHFDNSEKAYSYIRMTASSQMMRHTSQLYKLEQFEKVKLELVKKFKYRLDPKIISVKPIGLSTQSKKLLRQITPPFIYSFGAFLKTKVLASVNSLKS